MWCLPKVNRIIFIQSIVLLHWCNNVLLVIQTYWKCIPVSRCTRWYLVWNILPRDFWNVCFLLLLPRLPDVPKRHWQTLSQEIVSGTRRRWFVLSIWKYTYPCDRWHGDSHDTRWHNCSHGIMYFLVIVYTTNKTKKRQFNSKSYG